MAKRGSGALGPDCGNVSALDAALARQQKELEQNFQDALRKTRDDTIKAQEAAKEESLKIVQSLIEKNNSTNNNNMKLLQDQMNERIDATNAEVAELRDEVMKLKAERRGDAVALIALRDDQAQLRTSVATA